MTWGTCVLCFRAVVLPQAHSSYRYYCVVVERLLSLVLHVPRVASNSSSLCNYSSNSLHTEWHEVHFNFFKARQSLEKAQPYKKNRSSLCVLRYCLRYKYVVQELSSKRIDYCKHISFRKKYSEYSTRFCLQVLL